MDGLTRLEAVHAADASTHASRSTQHAGSVLRSSAPRIAARLPSRIRRVDAVGALRAEHETNWRRGYLVYFRRVLEAGCALGINLGASRPGVWPRKSTDSGACPGWRLGVHPSASRTGTRRRPSGRRQLLPGG